MNEIITEHVNPPIPVRSYDWSAVRRDYEEGGLVGWGETKQEAVDDLLDKEGSLWNAPAPPTSSNRALIVRGRIES